LSSEGDELVDVLMAASRAVVAMTARAIASVNEQLTVPQYRALVIVVTVGPQSVGSLAENLDAHQSTMTRMCDRLVALDLIVRSPSETDRREVTIAPTPRGTELVSQVMAARREVIETVAERVEPADREAVVRALREFAVDARESDSVTANARV
jgi:DNA-binding MarR family transcriptional regulator